MVGGEFMKKKRREFDIAFPESINAEHQEIPVIHADPFGSYTGLVNDLDEKPVQDADDL